MYHNRKKRIRIQVGNICSTSEMFDILVCSAFKNGYSPTRQSLIGSLLFEKVISVKRLSYCPEID